MLLFIFSVLYILNTATASNGGVSDGVFLTVYGGGAVLFC